MRTKAADCERRLQRACRRCCDGRSLAARDKIGGCRLVVVPVNRFAHREARRRSRQSAISRRHVFPTENAHGERRFCKLSTSFVFGLQAAAMRLVVVVVAARARVSGERVARLQSPAGSRARARARVINVCCRRRRRPSTCHEMRVRAGTSRRVCCAAIEAGRPTKRSYASRQRHSLQLKSARHLPRRSLK